MHALAAVKTAVSEFRRIGRRKTDTSVQFQSREYYVLEDLFDVLLGTFGPELTTKMILDSENIMWSVRLVCYCRERLTPELREKLATSVIRSKDFPASWSFLRIVEGLSTSTREKLLDNVPNVDEATRVKYLAEPAIWEYDPS